MKNVKAITLISLVITIIILIILAAVAINMTIGKNGIFTKAQEAKKAQIVAEAKEKIGLEILNAQIDATEKNEEVQQTKIEEIISKYGELQADGDTIKLKDSGYEISLTEIYNGTTSNSGGSTGNTELDNLKTELAKTNATSAQILKDYKAYSNGQLITGTMENYAGQTVTASSTNSDDANIYLTIPEAGYYDTNSKISTSSSNINKAKLLKVGTYLNPTDSQENAQCRLDFQNKNAKSVTVAPSVTGDSDIWVCVQKFESTFSTGNYIGNEKNYQETTFDLTNVDYFRVILVKVKTKGDVYMSYNFN